MSNFLKFDPRAIHDLNIPSERASFQLQNATFIFENELSYLILSLIQGFIQILRGKLHNVLAQYRGSDLLSAWSILPVRFWEGSQFHYSLILGGLHAHAHIHAHTHTHTHKHTHTHTVNSQLHEEDPPPAQKPPMS